MKETFGKSQEAKLKLRNCAVLTHSKKQKIKALIHLAKFFSIPYSHVTMSAVHTDERNYRKYPYVSGIKHNKIIGYCSPEQFERVFNFKEINKVFPL